MKRYNYILTSISRPGCPKCGQEQFCPCVNCAIENTGKITWIWQEDGEGIACGKCGLLLHVDQWEEIEMKALVKMWS